MLDIPLERIEEAVEPGPRRRPMRHGHRRRGQRADLPRGAGPGRARPRRGYRGPGRRACTPARRSTSRRPSPGSRSKSACTGRPAAPGGPAGSHVQGDGHHRRARRGQDDPHQLHRQDPARQEADRRAGCAHRPGRQTHERDDRLEAKTIHRLLVFDPKTSGSSSTTPQHPLDGDVFIIDETSMLDMPAGLADRPGHPAPRRPDPRRRRGPAPVRGPGLRAAGHHRLRHRAGLPADGGLPPGRRAARSSPTPTASTRARCPTFPREKVESPGSTDFYFVEVAEPDKAVDMVRRDGLRAHPAEVRLRPRGRHPGALAHAAGRLGCRNLNAVLQEALNPSGPAIQRYGWTFRVGDKVMQTVNDYDKDVFNGDIGRDRRDRRGGAGECSSASTTGR